MTTTLGFFCAVAVFSGHLAAEPSPNCNTNEQWSTCPPTCGSQCPTSEDDVTQQGCSNSNLCPEAACACLFNHLRLSNGTCVPGRECPPFKCSRPNEHYDSCPPYCPSDDCAQATPDGRCPLFGRIGFVLTCTPKCRCNKGFWRKNGVCVPYNQCSVPE